MNQILQNKHFKYATPFFIAIIGGSFCLKYYCQLRYDLYNERHIITKIKDISKPPVTLEEEYEEYKKSVDLDNWQNIRGPRPWENDNQDYKELIEKRAEESKNQWVFKR